MSRYTSKSEDGVNQLVLKNKCEDFDGSVGDWSISTSPTGTNIIQGSAIDKFAEYEDAEEQDMSKSGTNKWIPVKDVEPSKDGHYLVSFDDGFVTGVEYCDGDWELWAGSGEPVAWMNLPNPYQESN